VGGNLLPGSIFPHSGNLVHRYIRGLYGLDIGPLWFIEVLLMLSIAYVLYRAATRAPDRNFKNTPGLPGNPAIVGFALMVGLATFLVRVWLPVGWTYPPLNLQLPFFPQYISMFIPGVVANQSNWLIPASKGMGKAWPRFTMGIVVFLPVLFVLSGGLEGDVSSALGGFHWQALAYAVWEQLVCMGMTISLLGFFYRKFNRQGMLAKSMSASAFTVFILHAPILVCLTLLLRNYSLHPLLKFILIAPLAVALCFLIANVVRKLPVAREIL